jgi:hypothetical protein
MIWIITSLKHLIDILVLAAGNSLFCGSNVRTMRTASISLDYMK